MLFLLFKEMRIYLKLLPILLLASLSVAWLPTTAKVIALLRPSEGRLAPLLVEKIRAVSGDVLDDELEELLEVSNVQEIIWRLQEQGAVDRAAALQALLQHQLEHSAVRSVRNLRGGVSGARLIELDDGLRAVLKTVDNDKDAFGRELQLYRFDNLTGMQVVPLTTTRALAGEKGSVQLYVENSLSAFDILVAKRRQLGLSRNVQDSHVLFNRAITPPASPAVKTLRLLSLDSDDDNPGNYLFPSRGRQIAIDGGRAFTANAEKVAENIRHLQEHPEEYLLDEHLIANMEKHFAVVEEMFADHRLKQHLHDTFASYQEVVENKTHVNGKGKKNVGRAMLAALAAGDWQAADRLLKSHEHLFYLETPDLLAVARRKRNWQLLRWMRQHDPYLGGEVLEYALSASDYEFAARLSALGVKIHPVFNAVHENLRRAIAQEQNMAAHNIDWDAIDWEAIDWQAVRAYADPAHSRLDSAAVDVVWEYLDTALQIGDMDAADNMLRNYASAANKKQRLALFNLLGDDAVVKDLQKAEWLITHEVILDVLAKPQIMHWHQYNALFDRLRGHVFNYAFMFNPDEQQVQARTKVLNFISRLCITHPFFHGYFLDLARLFDDMLASKQETWVTQEQLVQRLQQVLNIFQANGMHEKRIEFLQTKLDV